MYDDYKLKSLHLILPKTITYSESYDGQTKWVYFLIEDHDLFEKFNTICDKDSADIKNNLISNLSVIRIFRNRNKILC